MPLAASYVSIDASTSEMGAVGVGVARYVLDITNTAWLPQMPEIRRNFRLTYERCYGGVLLNRFKVLGVLDQLSKLRVGWNGNGATRIEPDIIESAKRFISDMPGNIVSAPQVVPMTRGRLQFEWHSGDRSLEIEFEDPERIHYLKWDSLAEIQEEAVIPANDHEKVLDLLNWFSAK